MRYLLLLAALFVGQVGRASAVDPPAATVHVRAGDGSGTGVVVASENGFSVVVTNRHVAEHGLASGQLPFVEREGKRYPVKYYAAHPTDDLGVLVVEAELPTVPLADADPSPGTPVTLFGYDYRGQGRLLTKQGVSAAPRGDQFSSDIACISGDSGGGVFDPAGRLVAVNHSYELDPKTYARGPMLGVRVAKVRSFLRDKLTGCCPKFAGEMNTKAQPAAAAAAPSGPKVPAPKTYADVYAAVKAGGRAVLCVGGDCPAADCKVPSGYLGLEDGVYDFYAQDGAPVLLKRGGGCANGRCFR